MTPSQVSDRVLLAGRYRIVGRLGSGGMARVLLAEDERLDRPVAIKRLPTDSPEEALRRFQREARLGASLNHPNVVSIYDSLADEDAVLIVMEYVEGRSLEEMLKEGPLGPEATIAILRQIGEALDHVHARGVIHRDVKPSNVLVRDDGVAKLADLGIATAAGATAITEAESVIGTLRYIAPERLDGETNHPAADVFSLAALAYEALSGKRAQKGETPAEVVEQAASGPPPDLRRDWPDAPLAAAAVLRDGMSRNPDRRPRGAGELVRRLAAALGEPLGAAVPTRTQPLAPPDRPTGEEPGRPTSRTRMLAAGALAIGALVLGVLLATGLGDDGGQTAARSGGDGKAKSPPPSTTTTTATEVTTVEAPPPPAAPESSGAVASDGASLNDQGYALIQAGRYEEAVPILQQAVDSFPDGSTDLNYAYALFNLGHALRLSGQPNEAIPILEQRLQIPNQQGVVQRELEAAYAEAGLAEPD